MSRRYQIESLRGSGGEASVYKARELGEIPRTVALRRTVAAHAGEIYKVAGMLPAGFPQLLGHHQQGSEHIQVWNWIAGPTMEEVAATGVRMPVGVVLGILEQALGHLQAANQVTQFGQKPGFVHGDPTPSNMLLTSTGEVLFTDFGLTAIDRSDARGGRPGFRAPEQRPDGQVTTASDLFALGRTATFLLVPSIPPPPTQGREAERRHRQYLADILDSRRDVGDDVGDLLRAMMRFEPGARPSHRAALEWIRALHSELGGQLPRWAEEHVGATEAARKPLADPLGLVGTTIEFGDPPPPRPAPLPPGWMALAPAVLPLGLVPAAAALLCAAAVVLGTLAALALRPSGPPATAWRMASTGGEAAILETPTTPAPPELPTDAPSASAVTAPAPPVAGAAPQHAAGRPARRLTPPPPPPPPPTPPVEPANTRPSLPQEALWDTPLSVPPRVKPSRRH